MGAALSFKPKKIVLGPLDSWLHHGAMYHNLTSLSEVEKLQKVELSLKCFFKARGGLRLSADHWKYIKQLMHKMSQI